MSRNPTAAGRETAFEFARHLAGCGLAITSGLAEQADMLERFYREAQAAGGQAVANTDSVADWDGAKRMIDQAISAFGALDVLVNNAGILRDRMLTNMSIDEWDAVIKVHLRGTFCPTRHAASATPVARSAPKSDPAHPAFELAARILAARLDSPAAKAPPQARSLDARLVTDHATGRTLLITLGVVPAESAVPLAAAMERAFDDLARAGPTDTELLRARVDASDEHDANDADPAWWARALASSRLAHRAPALPRQRAHQAGQQQADQQHDVQRQRPQRAGVRGHRRGQVERPDERHVLALVRVGEDGTDEVRYLRRAFEGMEGRVHFAETSVNFSWQKLWDRAEVPS